MSAHVDTRVRCTKHGAITGTNSERMPACPMCQDELVERVDALLAENQQLRQALAQILDEAGAYHGSPNRKTNALHAITVKARTALDGTP